MFHNFSRWLLLWIFPTYVLVVCLVLKKKITKYKKRICPLYLYWQFSLLVLFVMFFLVLFFVHIFHSKFKVVRASLCICLHQYLYFGILVFVVFWYFGILVLQQPWGQAARAWADMLTLVIAPARQSQKKMGPPTIDWSGLVLYLYSVFLSVFVFAFASATFWDVENFCQYI